MIEHIVKLFLMGGSCGTLNYSLALIYMQRRQNRDYHLLSYAQASLYGSLSISLVLRIHKLEERKRRLYLRILNLYSIYILDLEKSPLQINRKNQIHKYFRVQSYMKVGSPNIAASVTICYFGWSPPSIIIGGAYVTSILVVHSSILDNTSHYRSS